MPLDSVNSHPQPGSQSRGCDPEGEPDSPQEHAVLSKQAGKMTCEPMCPEETPVLELMPGLLNIPPTQQRSGVNYENESSDLDKKKWV